MHGFTGVFLPIEVQNRELPGKMLLAAHLSSKGIPTYIGHKSEIYDLADQATEPGLLFNKSVGYKNNKDLYRSLREKGFRIVAQDEEAGIIFDKYSDFYDRRSSLRDIEVLDHWFCWGFDEWNFLTQLHKNHLRNISVTGSPRAALWGKPGMIFWDSDIKKIRDEHGDFILIATNNVLSNSPLTPSQLLRNRMRMPDWEKDGKKIYDEKTLFEKKSTEEFVDLVKQLIAKTSLNVVIRPHPAEDLTFWKRIFSSLNRVKVLNQGPVSPWIMASRGVVHNGSTVGLESALSGVRTFALKPRDYNLDQIPKSFPFQLSYIFESVADLVEGILSKGENSNSELINNKIEHVGTFESLYKIEGAIRKLLGDYLLRDFVSIGRDSWLHDIREVLRTSSFRPKTKAVRMDRYKRPSLSTQIIQSYLERANNILGVSNSQSLVRVSQNAYRLYLHP